MLSNSFKFQVVALIFYIIVPIIINYEYSCLYVKLENPSVILSSCVSILSENKSQRALSILIFYVRANLDVSRTDYVFKVINVSDFLGKI